MSHGMKAAISKGKCLLCGRHMLNSETTITPPTLGIEVHTTCYEEEYGRPEVRFTAGP